MIITKTCKAASDFELNIGFDRKIKYHIENPKNRSNGILFFISCFGLEFEYIQKWLKKAADKFDMHAISVEYHCYQSRPETGASITMTDKLQREIAGIATMNGLHINSIGPESLTNIGNALPEKIQLDGAIFKPPNGDYQNFGLMQALDHLYVIADLIKQRLETDFNNIVLFGSSHGGYIAHIIAKLAPNTIRLIIDNSSYISPPPNYLNLGSEYLIPFGKNLILGFSTYTLWQYVNPYDKTYYDISKKMIRDTANPEHFISNKQTRPVKIITYNAESNDYISFPSDKKYQQQVYKKAGFEYELNMIDENKLNPPFKILCHGMNASLWELVCLNENAIRNIFAERKTILDFHNKTKLNFNCYNAIYTIIHNFKGYPVYVEIQKERYI